MGCVQSYFRKAHTASLSPSSTQASENAGLIAESPTDPKKQLLSEEDLHVITSPPTTLDATTTAVAENGIAVGHAPDANGGSKTGTGLGPGIAALAASTGTVAILGAAADTEADSRDEVEQVLDNVKDETEILVEDVEEINKDATISASPASEDPEEIQETKTSDEPLSPTINDQKEELEIKDNSVTSSPIPDDKNESISGKESSLSATGKEVIMTPSPDEPTNENDQTESVADVDVSLKELSRPTSAIVAEILTKQPLEDDDEAFPAPPPPEDEALESTINIDNIPTTISERASPASYSKDETETHSRNRRSITKLEITEDQKPTSASETLIAEETDLRPASVIEIESKPQSRAASIVQSENELEIDSTEADKNIQEQIKETIESPCLLQSVTEKDVDEVLVEVEQTPAKEVSDASRPQSAEAVVIESVEEELKDETEVVETITPLVEPVDEPVVEEDIVIDDAATTEPEGHKSHVEDITSVEKDSLELAKNAATTIQASFRGHQARKTLRKIANNDDAQEEVKEAQEIDVPPSVEEKSLDEEIINDTDHPLSDDVLNDETPPQLFDTDNDVVDSLTANDEKEQSVAPESIEELTSTDGKNEIQQIINVIINPERLESQTESLEETDKISDDKSTVAAESEAESLDALLNDVNRAASNVSESTVSVGDSISALRGSEADSSNAVSVSEELVSHVIEVAVEEVEQVENKKEAAATTIQASVRGFQARQKLQKIADDTKLPLPEPLNDILQEVQSAANIDDDDLPPPPEDCDIEPPPPEEQIENDIDEDIASVLTDIVDTPRSPETGEKLKKTDESEQVSLDDLPNGEQPEDGILTEVDDFPPPIDPESELAAKLALLQRPQQCDELPENRWETEDGKPKEPIIAIDTDQILADELAGLQKPQECDELPEHRGELENGDLNEASSAEVDDSSLSSAATKIQAGARGYLTRKHMKDTFSTTAPSITDSQQSIGAALTSQEDDDGVQTSGSLETEVQRLSMEEPSNLGVTAVVISNINETLDNSLENGTSEITEAIKEKGLSLDSQLTQEKKTGLITSYSVQDPIVTAEEDQKVWQTLQNELEEAATTIQSNFRGFSTRQRLNRENAVHMPTISSAESSSDKTENIPVLRSSGEFHDMMVLPPAAMLDKTSVNDDAMANCQQSMSEAGKPHEGHVTVNDVTASVSHTSDDVKSLIINMGEATEAVPKEQLGQAAAVMKGDSVANAATKIQAGFRGYKVRKQMRQVHVDGVKKNGPRSRRRSSHNLVVQSRQQTVDKVNADETTLLDRSATKIQAGIRGFLVRKRRREEKDAAVKIQAGFRGYKVRRDRKPRAPVEK